MFKRGCRSKVMTELFTFFGTVATNYYTLFNNAGTFMPINLGIGFSAIYVHRITLQVVQCPR